MTLSVIVPTKNRIGDLIKTVQFLMEQTRRPDELIIVDQSTTDEGGRILSELLNEFPEIKLVYIWDGAINGLPMARNRGFHSSTGELVCYLDDDTSPEPAYLEEVECGFAQFPEWNGLCGRLTEPRRGPAFRRFAASLFRRGLFRDDRSNLSDLEMPREIRILTGAACAFQRGVLDRFSFDEKLTGYALGEDFEFCLRAGRAFRFGFYPAAKAHHRRSATGRPEKEELRSMAQRSARYLWRQHRRGVQDDLCYAWLRLGFALEWCLSRVAIR